MKIIELKSENVKKLHAVTIRPSDNLVTISGRNGQGKSSVLDSILYGLCGDRSLPDVPIRQGAKRANIKIDLGDIIVEKVIDKRGSRLTVISADGEIQRSPQRLLDDLVGKISFDPLAFARQKPAQQSSILKQIVGLDSVFEDLDAERAKLYEERTLINRQLKGTQARVTGIPVDVAQADPEERASSDLMQRIDSAMDHNRSIDVMDEKIDALKADYKRQQQEIKKLRDALQEAEAELIRMEDRGKQHRDTRKKLGGFVDVAPLKEQLAQLETHNNRARQAQEWRRLNAEADRYEAKANELTTAINGIDERKHDALANADFPLDGLVFDDDGVIYNGIPLTQASSAEQIRVGVAIAMALNPKLRVARIMDGSLLDDESMQMISEMANEHDFQIWIERITDGNATVVIEDGSAIEQSEWLEIKS